MNIGKETGGRPGHEGPKKRFSLTGRTEIAPQTGIKKVWKIGDTTDPKTFQVQPFGEAGTTLFSSIMSKKLTPAVIDNRQTKEYGRPGFGDDADFARYAERIKSEKLHTSPFEAFTKATLEIPFYKFYQELQYDGTVKSVIDDLRQSLQAPEREGNDKKLALAPHTLVRGIIDWNFENPDEKTMDRVNGAIAIGLTTYEGDYSTALSVLDRYEEELEPAMLQSEIHQPHDIASWMGYDPDCSYQTAMDLAFHFDERPLLFITLGQGATAAGMDVFLRNADITEVEGSAFYAVRFSRNKKGDKRPIITKAEAEYLQEIAQGRQVVLFEEDTVTARTLQMGTDFFRQHVFPNQSVYPVSNFKGGSSSFVV